MKFKDKMSKERWNQFVKVNSDSYGQGVIIFSKNWANQIEKMMKENPGRTFGDVVKIAEQDADAAAGGITGFMYGCAVAMLSEVWIRGEDLRRWHNINTQYSDEGYAANKSGGILNPALIVVDTHGW
jgi:hypothetical protein